jgi:predicted ATP-grasp superfamily ATP-dependent carboligase
MPQVLVLDAYQRSALAVARSLGQRGVTVLVADVERDSLAGSSRYATHSLAYPDPVVEPVQFVDWVSGTARSYGVDAVFPLTDTTTMVLHAQRPDLGACRLLSAPRDAYELCSDKARLLELAESVGVDTPGTQQVHSLDELRHALAGREYPVVLKPARSKLWLAGRIVSTAVFIARNFSQAIEYARGQVWFDSVPCILQSYVEGYGAGVFALYAGAHPRAWFAHRRLREKPPSGGVSVLSESVALEPSLRAAAQRILDAAGWNGAAMVEFRVAADGTPYLMEVNARLWGSLQLAIDAGIDFPWLIYQGSVAGDSTEAAGYRTGIRLRWLLGDVDNLAAQMRDGSVSRRNKLRALTSFTATCFDGRCRQEVFRPSDPLPAVHELHAWIRALRLTSSHFSTTD